MRLVALCGPPNTGKTTLFNALTRSRAKVGNYPGITVERRVAKCKLAEGEHVDLLDIPGTYSLVARSAEEQIAIDAVLGLRALEPPDAVVVCVDATSPMPGLYLALQILELGRRVVVAMTMVDEAGDDAPTAAELSDAIGVPVAEIDGRRRRGLDPLRAAIRRTAGGDEPAAELPWTPSEPLAAAVADVRDALPDDWLGSDAVALWALMSVGDDDELDHIPAAVRDRVADYAEVGEALDLEIVGARYAWLEERLAEIVRERTYHRRSDAIDRLLLHRVTGFVTFVALMVVLFQALFAWCDPVIGWIEIAFEWIGQATQSALPEHLLTDLLVDGVIAGVGGVLVFLPQILLLFFFLGLLEDLGYMARVAVLMDRIMSKMNLHGRAFVPMLSGFACAVPAILATRTMERRRDRLLTMLVVPLMTCSARLPVYTLVIAALIPPGSLLGVPVQGLLMVGMYLFSVSVALIAAWVLSKTLPALKGKRLPMVIELPRYRLPQVRGVVVMMWERTALFVREAGTVILACTIVLWFLLAFPRGAEVPDDAPPEVANAAAAAQLEGSYGGRLGHAIEPAIRPLGFDWKIGVGIVGAFAAREVFVSTMGVVYAVGSGDEDTTALRDQLRAERDADGNRAYTPLVGLSLMIFFALACQCMSTLAVVKRETGGYRWPVFLFVYMTALAWLASLAVFQIGSLLGF